MSTLFIFSLIVSWTWTLGYTVKVNVLYISDSVALYGDFYNIESSLHYLCSLIDLVF